MNVFIITATTTDGFIAKNSHHNATWTSPADKKRFVEITKKAGVMVMGLNTFKTIGKALPGRKTIVYSSNKDEKLSGAEMTDLAPKDLIEKLSKEGHDSVAICGGSSIYTQFMESGLVKKIFLTIEPIIFGSGMHIFNKDLDYKLELVSLEKVESTLLLEYNVL